MGRFRDMESRVDLSILEDSNASTHILLASFEPNVFRCILKLAILVYQQHHIIHTLLVGYCNLLLYNNPSHLLCTQTINFYHQFSALLIRVK